MKRAPITRIPRPGRLEARWGRVDRYSGESITYVWGEWDGRPVGRATSRCLIAPIEEIPVLDGKCLRDVLIERGYDITTLRFTIDRKAESEDAA